MTQRSIVALAPSPETSTQSSETVQEGEPPPRPPALSTPTACRRECEAPLRCALSSLPPRAPLPPHPRGKHKRYIVLQPTQRARPIEFTRALEQEETPSAPRCRNRVRFLDAASWAPHLESCLASSLSTCQAQSGRKKKKKTKEKKKKSQDTRDIRSALGSCPARHTGHSRIQGETQGNDEAAPPPPAMASTTTPNHSGGHATRDHRPPKTYTTRKRGHRGGDGGRRGLDVLSQHHVAAGAADSGASQEGREAAKHGGGWLDSRRAEGVERYRGGRGGRGGGGCRARM